MEAAAALGITRGEGIPGALLSVPSTLDPNLRDAVPILHEGRASTMEFEGTGLCRFLEARRTTE